MPPIPPKGRSWCQFAFKKLDYLCTIHHTTNNRVFIPQSAFDQLFTQDVVGEIIHEIELRNRQECLNVGGATNNSSSVLRLVSYLLRLLPAILSSLLLNTSFVTTASVRISRPKKLSELSDVVYAGYRRILAILLLVQSEEHLLDFVQNGINDEKLPLGQKELNLIDRTGDLSKSTFIPKQYLFLLKPFETQDITDVDYPYEYALPIIREEKLSNGRGNFGTVWEIEIHPGYDRFPGHSEPKHVYARKTLSSIRDKEALKKSFEQEVKAGIELRHRQHPNILPLLAHYKYGEDYNLIFPRCECNLHEHFRGPFPQVCSDPAVNRLRFLERIAKLSTALSAIHFSESNDKRVCGYHRDLKPENILKKGGDFLIADFGLTVFTPYTGQQTGVNEWHSTRVYMAPECDKGGRRIGRLADIWALGCVFAEAISFVFRGKEGVEEFEERRKTRMENNITIYRYHDGEDITTEVRSYLDGLQEQSVPGHGGEAISEFVKLVRMMLASTPRARPRAIKVGNVLHTILEKESRRLDVELLFEKPKGYPEENCRKLEDALSNVARISKLVSPRRRGTGFNSISSLPSVSESELFREETRESSPLRILEKMNTMFLIDNSWCEDKLWCKVGASLELFSKLAIQHDPDGIDLDFVHAENRTECLGRSDAVMELFNQVGRKAQTEHSTSESFRLSVRLKDILEEYIKTYEEGDSHSVTPLNLIVITCNELEENASHKLADTIAEWAAILEYLKAPSYQLGVQFVKIGGASKKFFYIDDVLPEKRNVRDIVDYTYFDPDLPREDGKKLCKIMCGGVIKAWDKGFAPS